MLKRLLAGEFRPEPNDVKAMNSKTQHNLIAVTSDLKLRFGSRRLRLNGLAATLALVMVAFAAVVYVSVQGRAEPVDLSSAPAAADFFSSALEGLKHARCGTRGRETRKGRSVNTELLRTA